MKKSRKAKEKGKFIEPNNLLSSTEADRDTVCYCNKIGIVSSTMKSANSYSIRPIYVF